MAPNSFPMSAHDWGLYHYWRAKKANSPEEAAAHWLHVICHWALVLESPQYWRDWIAERSQAYGKPITQADVAHVQELLKKKLSRELTRSDQDEVGRSLEATFHQEIKATRLLQRVEAGVLLPSGQRLAVGPLLAGQLALTPQIDALFRRSDGTTEDEALSLRAILAYAQPQTMEAGAPALDVWKRLRLCFSQLGIAAIYLERADPQRALSALSSARCTACYPESAQFGDTPRLMDRLPMRCRDACVVFPQKNPAYAAISRGRDLHARHTAELGAGACLALAQQALLDQPADIKSLWDHLQAAFEITQVVGLYDALRRHIGDLILEWADDLKVQQRWDDAVALLDGAADLSMGDRWRGRLADLLNVRSVQNCNKQRWAVAVADLRRACALNPYVPTYRRNLEQALYAYADERYKAGDIENWQALLVEASTLEALEPGLPQMEAPIPAVAMQPSPSPPARPRRQLFLSDNERANPALFDEGGLLKSSVFDVSGQRVLDQARQETADRGESLLRLPALVAALAQYPGGETERLLVLQEIAPQRLLAQARASAPSQVDDEPIKSTTPLSQFNLWYTVFKVLDLAWEIASLDGGMIGEPHLLYGVCISGSANKLLQATGLDVDRLLEEAAWR